MRRKYVVWIVVAGLAGIWGICKLAYKNAEAASCIEVRIVSCIGTSCTLTCPAGSWTLDSQAVTGDVPIYGGYDDIKSGLCWGNP